MRKLKTHRTSTIDFNPVWINTNSCCEANWRNAVQTYKWMLSLRVLPFAFSLFLHQKQKQRVDCLHPSNTLPYHLFLQNVESYALKMLFSTVLHFRSCWEFSARCLLHFSPLPRQVKKSNVMSMWDMYAGRRYCTYLGQERFGKNQRIWNILDTTVLRYTQK